MSRIATADLRSGRGAVFAVILAACLIALIGFGIRSSFGLYLDPMTVAKGWSRETFALAMAIQNLLWGIGVPVAGAIADRYGPGLVNRPRRRHLRHGHRGHGGVGQRARAPSERRPPRRPRRRVHLVLARARRHRAGRLPGTTLACTRLRHRGRLARPSALLTGLPGPDIELRLVRLARAGLLHHPDHNPARVHPAGHDQSAR